MIRFLHAADLHLDSPLRGLARYEGAPVEALHRALRGAVENLVQVALDERVALVVIAGDLYDGDCRDYNTLLFFCSQMQKLAAAGIKVVVISGNHDAANTMTRSLRLDHVHRLPTDRPATVAFDDLGVAVHGQGFANREVRDNLACAYPAAVRGMFNIGLLHTCATGSDGHESYAPCSLDDLRAKGYDYWALGHVHTRGVLSTADEPPIVFSGNVQGRHIRETGPKGVMLVEVDGSQRATASFRQTDVFRWERVLVDARDARNVDDVLAAAQNRLRSCWNAAGGAPMAVRVTVAGPSRAHERLAGDWPAFTEQVRAQGIQASDGGGLWIEEVKQQTKPLQKYDATTLDGPLAELHGLLRDLAGDDALLADLVGEIPELNAAQLSEYIDVKNLAALREHLPAVESLLVGRLQLAEEGR